MATVDLEIAPVSPRSDYHKIPIALGVGTTEVWGRNGWLVGWSLRGAAAAAFTADLFDGPTAASPQIAASASAAGGADTKSLAGHGIPIDSGLTIVVALAGVVGCLWVRLPES